MATGRHPLGTYSVSGSRSAEGGGIRHGLSPGGVSGLSGKVKRQTDCLESDSHASVLQMLGRSAGLTGAPGNQ